MVASACTLSRAECPLRAEAARLARIPRFGNRSAMRRTRSSKSPPTRPAEATWTPPQWVGMGKEGISPPS